MIKVTKEDYEEFKRTFHDIINHEMFLKMKEYKHHNVVTCYDHSLNVALHTYVYCKKHNLRVIEATRAALLHDFYLYDWHIPEHWHRLHGYKHPGFSIQNARKYFNINKFEARIIRSHMFPLTIFHMPISKEGWVVCIIDKKCANYEIKHHSTGIDFE